MNLRPIAALLLLAVALLASISCASGAGQITASEAFPSVDIVTHDLEEYLDAGIAPDGSPMTPEEVFSKRGNVVALRNLFLVATGEEKEALPRLSDAPQDLITTPPEDGDAPAAR